MSDRDPMFVSLGGEIWANVDHIVGVEPDPADPKRCLVVLSTGSYVNVSTPPRDFLNRMTGVVWK